MPEKLSQYLASLDAYDGDAPPVIDLDLYFAGNTDEESIAPNQWGYGRPPIAQLYERFREIAARPDVEKVLVGLHQDWCDYGEADVDAKRFPPAENVHIFTSARQDEVARWIAGMEADGVIPGWPYGKPDNAPDPSQGYTVLSVCWD
ncbi:hypothetical protein CSQ92_15900 [Janthinobacterium sp. BJB446]|jgi:hypothetical protein|uniref:hypothetical protein n=1 Tax=Janthinobacterium sp. BJB446 TaxID=2048009 RepID=UPI000C0E7B53|nr:hypothetical protein [Janthinobacterium sp. BJB446]PHV20872.1 hypothetical protein CSQ92_15900 [Janthinobacterium sp. BJB446]